MTFDEMIKELKDMGDEYFIEPLMLLPEVEKLRETYAKPVEMTREQYDLILELKTHYEAFKFILEHIKLHNIGEQDLMRAWLHPELIKVVE